MEWCPKKDGKLVFIWPEVLEYSLDPMHPLSGQKVCEKFFGLFEEHFPEECGKGLNFFFSDELNFNIRGNLWNDYFAKEFELRKGYDIRPVLPAVFMDMGEETPKIRLDYYDVIIQLEENYFKTIYEWHESRNMIYGCDHGGRGYDVTEFGDYFRTQKFNQGPGCDQPRLQSDIIKNKVASSIAHLYQRPRVWLEGFYGSGWGTSSADFADAVARNFVMGHNLLSLHGMYYSTHGGWWEWAPPCNGYHMPYWKDMGGFFRGIERLSFLMSQGHHVCHVGIVYPVASVEAGYGEEAVQTAFALAKQLYPCGIDFDFLDFESIAGGKVENKALKIAEESYRMVVVPSMQAVRFSMIEKLLELKRDGGEILFVGELPECSDRKGRRDKLLSKMVEEMCAEGENHVQSVEDALREIQKKIVPDVVPYDWSGDIFLNHRCVRDKDIFMVYGVPKHTYCTFQATGKVSLWNIFDGKRYELLPEEQDERTTTLSLPLDGGEFQILVFDKSLEDADERLSVNEEKTVSVSLDGAWKFTLMPSLDNRFGDYELPITEEKIGAKLSGAAYAESKGEIPDDAAFSGKERFSYGPYWKVKGPFSKKQEYEEAFEAAKKEKWNTFEDYSFSMRYGVWNDPGQEGYHGLKCQVSDEFLTIGKKRETNTGSVYEKEEGMGRVYATYFFCKESGYYCFGTGSVKPERFALDGIQMDVPQSAVWMEQGYHSVAVGYTECGRTYVTAVLEHTKPHKMDLSMQWYEHPGMATFDCRGLKEEETYGFFRFMTPPGTSKILIPCDADELRVWAEETECTVVKENGEWWSVSMKEPERASIKIILQIPLNRGKSHGALIREKISFVCKEGVIHTGDWGEIDGLSDYSGCVAYTKQVTLPNPLPSGRPVLQLGKVVSSVRAFVNEEEAGIRVMGPWEFDLSGLLKPGENEIRLEISNTLANHYQSIPTRYRKDTASGLMGPCAINFYEATDRVKKH